jgi:hypothetical protein
MRISKKAVYIGISIILSVSSLGVMKVAADDSDSSTPPVSDILAGCVSAKSTLSQLHASDALLRVNRGQIYESLSTKLMTRFNVRVANNNLNNTSLVSVTDDYDKTLDDFRMDYNTYEVRLAAAINTDCQKQPIQFYNAVASARQQRSKVHSDIKKLNQYIDQYQKALDRFESDYKDATEKIGR